MRKLLSIALPLLVFASLIQFAPIASAQTAAKKGKWTTLFNGKSLKGWHMIGNADWKLADGVVQADKGAGYVVSDEKYSDYQLRVQIWVDEPANSGVFIRCEDPQNVSGMNAYEVNVYDKRADQTYRTGAIVDIAKPLAKYDAANKWTTIEITAQGPHITVAMNGVKTADGNDAKHPTGAIALQYGAGINNMGVVKFRKVEIKPL
jgi:Domain of Unknown Function (DUF1080)